MATLVDMSAALPSKPISLKRKRLDGTPEEIHVVMRLLTMREMLDARINARTTAARMQARFREHGDTSDDRRTIDEIDLDERMVELLATALRDPEDISKAYAPSAVIAAKFTALELQTFALEYEALQDSAARARVDLTVDDVEQWIERAADGELSFLSLVTSATRDEFVRAIAQEIQRLRTAAHVDAVPTNETKEASDDGQAP